MAENSGQINFNADDVLFYQDNDVMGFNSSMSNVSVGVSYSETLTSDPVGFHMNSGCDVLINGGGKEGSCEEKVKDLEDGGMFGGKGCQFSWGVMKNEDEKSLIQCSDKGLVFEFNDGVGIEQECENVGKIALSNEVRGVEVDGAMKAVDSFAIKDCPRDSRASYFASYKLQDGIPYVDVNTEESLEVKDMFLRNCHGLETSYGLKQPPRNEVQGVDDNLTKCVQEEIRNVALKNLSAIMEDDAQVNVIQKQTTDINISRAGLSKTIQYDCHGFDLVVDLNSYKSTQEEDSVYRELVSSNANFRISDLVWGKVRGHPWWPGQIYDPSIASEKAKRLRKENCYLIAYFGDQTFAWNEVSTIKPFHKHFSEMEKQSNMENFQHAIVCALEEASRRVEFGLSCPCVPGERSSKLKTEVIDNAGILQQSSRRNGGDRFVNAASFEPTELVNYVKSLAQSPDIEIDRLNFVSARAQLSAFYRSKGYSQLPEFAVHDRLFEKDTEILPVTGKEQCGDQINEQVWETHQGLSQTSKHISWNTKQSCKKNKLLSDLMSEKNPCNPNGEFTLEKKAGDNSTSRRGRKRKAAYDTSYDCFHHSKISANNSTSRRGRKPKAAYDTSGDCFNSSQTGNFAQLQNISINEMRSQLCSAAKDPAGENYSRDMIMFLSEFGKFTGRNNSVYLEQGFSLEQEHGGEIGVVTTTEAAAFMSTPTEELCIDSYWTDRVIQSNSEDQTFVKSQNEKEELSPAAEITPNPGLMHQETDGNLGSEPSNPVEHLAESSPTALTLKFTNLDSVPSTTNLNKIFGRFGPLIESKTELLPNTNRARVVFKRRLDAETAFSSAGKYSIFGPSLVSYRLKILPPPLKKGTGKRGRKRKNEKSSGDGAAV